MASGQRRIRINTQERAVSSDINRLQQFANQEFAEFHRYLLNVGTSEANPGTFTEGVTVATPLLAEVINGLLVKPVAGSTGLTVDAGVLMALQPDAAADDSNYKYVRDAGLLAGTLAIAANSSGDTRIDVVECRVNAVEATVSDSRDIFDAATGLFTATSVTKELKGRLEYRVRSGTSGGGMPANQSGWLPLMVASVPDGAADNDDVTFWDVRPLLADRANGPMNNLPPDELLDVNDDFHIVDPTHQNITGTCRAVLNGRHVGGTFRNTGPGTTAAFFNVFDPNNQDVPLVSGAISGNAHVYACTPFGLPRWARYTDGPSGRVPQSPAGIMIVSPTCPTYVGNPLAAIAIPDSYGLGGTVATNEAICVEVCRWKIDGGVNYAYHRTVNKRQRGQSGGLDGNYNVISSAGVDFHPRKEDIPANAKFCLVQIQLQFDIADAEVEVLANSVAVYNTNDQSGQAASHVQPQIIWANPTASPLVDQFALSGYFWMPLPREHGTPTVSPHLIQWAVKAGLTNVTNCVMLIQGFAL